LKNKIVSENIGRLIRDRNFTQKELSSKANISRNTINKLSSTKRENNPKLSTLIEISKELDVDFPQLFSRNINMKSTYDRDMNLESYLNIFIQNIEIKLRGSKQKFLSSDPGIRESTVSELLNSKNADPRLSTLIAISEQIDTRLELLFRRGEDV